MSIDDTIRRIVREEVRAALTEWQRTDMPSEQQSDLLGTREAAGLLGVAQGTLRDWRIDQKGPRAVKVGSLVKYRREDLDQWIAEQRTPR